MCSELAMPWQFSGACTLGQVFIRVHKVPEGSNQDVSDGNAEIWLFHNSEYVSHIPSAACSSTFGFYVGASANRAVAMKPSP